MATITEDMLDPDERSSRPRQRWSAPTLTWAVPAATTAIGMISAILIAVAPETWMRAGAALGLLLLAYASGLRDGRSELARELVLGRLRRDQREPGAGPDTRAA